MRVIVTNARSRIAYVVTRCLSSHGVEVITADSSEEAMSFYSRYSAGHFTYPSPYSNESGFIEKLLDKCRELQPDVLIPIYEETFVVSKHRDLFAEYTNLLVPKYADILAVHDKFRLSRLADQIGITVPKTVELADLETRIDLVRNLNFPVLIKPKQGGGAWAIKRVESLADLLNILQRKSYPDGLPSERFLVQELISGRVSCCGMLMHNGEYYAGHCYCQLRETPPTGGTATYRQSVVSPEMIASLKCLLEYLKWDGVCQADFIIEERTGTPYLIDVNPRFWGSLIQAIASGVDFPYLLCLLATGSKFDPVINYETNIRSRWIWGDIKSFFERIHLKNKVEGLPILDYFKFSLQDKYDDFDLRDPVPFLVPVARHLLMGISQRRISPQSTDSKEGIWE